MFKSTFEVFLNFKFSLTHSFYFLCFGVMCLVREVKCLLFWDLFST